MKDLEHHTALVAVSRQGVALARRLAAAWPAATLILGERWIKDEEPRVRGLTGPLREAMPGLFREFRGLVFFLATGAVVRLIAPCLDSKFGDPAVVVVDGGANWAISLLAGHLGGANDLARRVARVLGCQPVITTASDVAGHFAVDLLGQAWGWQVEATPETLRRVAGHVVNGDPVALVLEVAVPDLPAMPPWVDVLTRLEPEHWGRYEAILWVTRRPEVAAWIGNRQVVVYRPPALVLGVGCDRGTSRQTIETAIMTCLGRHGCSPDQVVMVATIDIKGDEPGLLALVRERGWRLQLFDRQALAGVPVPNPSETVRRHLGVASVAEAAALLAAGLAGEGLIVTKCPFRGEDGRHVTVAAARMPT